MTTLTRAQERAISVILNKTPGSVTQVVGPAGTGKTYLIRELVAREAFGSVTAVAPTHKAVKILRQRLEGLSVDVKTVHAFLQAETKYQTDGTPYWKFSTADIPLPDLLILDETSMCSNEMFRELQILVKERGLRLVTLGDAAQLPPVNEGSTAFYEVYPIDYHLVKNIRNKRTKFNLFLEALRGIIVDPTRSHRNAHELTQWLSGYVPTYTPQRGKFSIDHLPLEIVTAYRSTPGAVMLAHRTHAKQNTVGQLNDWLRRALFPDTTAPYVTGDRLTLTDWCPIDEDGGQTLHTNDLVTVVGCTESSRTFYDESYRVYELEVEMDADSVGGTTYTLARLHADDQARWTRHDQRVRDEIRQAIALDGKRTSELWKAYHTARKSVHAPVDYAYALSVHKSQGSTYPAVFVCLSDFVWMLLSSETAQRKFFYQLLYVALSRSQTTALVF